MSFGIVDVEREHRSPPPRIYFDTIPDASFKSSWSLLTTWGLIDRMKVYYSNEKTRFVLPKLLFQYQIGN